MSTRICGNDAAFRFTWLGQNEFLCLKCASIVQVTQPGVVTSLTGEELSEHPTCQQFVPIVEEETEEPKREEEAPTVYVTPIIMPVVTEPDPEPAPVGGGGTFDGGGASSSFDSPDAGSDP